MPAASLRQLRQLLGVHKESAAASPFGGCTKLKGVVSHDGTSSAVQRAFTVQRELDDVLDLRVLEHPTDWMWFLECRQSAKNSRT